MLNTENCKKGYSDTKLVAVQLDGSNSCVRGPKSYMTCIQEIGKFSNIAKAQK